MKKFIIALSLALLFFGCSSQSAPEQKPHKAYNLRAQYPLSSSNNTKSLLEYYEKYRITMNNSSTFTEDYYHLIALIREQPTLSNEQILIVAELIFTQDGEFLDIADEVLFPRLMEKPEVFCKALTYKNVYEYMAKSSGKTPKMEELYVRLLNIPIDYSGDTPEGEIKIKESIKMKVARSDQKNSELGKYILEKW